MAPQSKPGEISDTTPITKTKIMHRFRAAKIAFDGLFLKPTLQAIYALYEIGYLKQGTPTPETLIATVAGWWSSTTKQLNERVDQKGLGGAKSGLTKVKCIDLLLKDAISNLESKTRGEEDVDEDEPTPTNALEKLSLQTSKPASSSSGIPKPILDLSTAIESNPQVINLLLSSAFAMVCPSDEYNKVPEKLFPESSISISSDDFEAGHFPNLETMSSKGELAKNLHGMKGECINLLSHITTKFSPILALAKSSLRIPGFPASVSQFVVIRTPKAVGEKIREFEGKEKDRMVPFHGTDLSFLPIILLEGLKATCDDDYGEHDTTLWMAEEPATSYWYARHALKESFSWPWKHNLYPNCGVLLGCELLGKRGPDQNYEGGLYGDGNYIDRPQPVHIFGPNDTTAIVVRYVFVLPQDVLVQYRAAPEAANLRPLMLKAFKSKTFQGT